MRYLFAFLCVCALGAVPLPQSVNAQAGEAATTPDPNLQEPAPSSEPASEEPALQLELTPAGVDVVPSTPRTVDGYTLEEMELRVKRAKIGLGISAGVLVVGGVILGTAAPNANILSGEAVGQFAAGAVVAFGGLVGMIITGGMLNARKRKLRRLQEAEYGRPHRVQWDLEASRLVF